MLHPQYMFPSLATEETSQETMFQQHCFLVEPGPYALMVTNKKTETRLQEKMEIISLSLVSVRLLVTIRAKFETSLLSVVKP